jgi:hypothetical protein
MAKGKFCLVKSMVEQSHISIAATTIIWIKKCSRPKLFTAYPQIFENWRSP